MRGFLEPCPDCGEPVENIGLVMTKNPDGTLHADCYFRTHKLVKVSPNHFKVIPVDQV